MKNHNIRLIIINSISEAKYFTNKYYPEYDNWFVLSTQHSVNDHFNNTNVVCHHVSEYYSNEFINEEMDLISEQVNRALFNLDNRINTK